MKLKFTERRRERLKKGYWMYKLEGYWWWAYDLNRWVLQDEREERYKGDMASTKTCRSVRAFRRELRKYVPKGIKATLEHRYFNIYGTVSGVGSKRQS